jgi:phage-related protein
VRSITYCGKDFSPYTSAELVEEAGHIRVPRTTVVPGRPGAVLLGSDVSPRILGVRLFLAVGLLLDEAGRAAVRHKLYSWLIDDWGGTLCVPGDPAMTYHDAICTDASSWSSLFEDGHCTLTFTCFDPIAYGDADSSTDTVITTGGTWATWPVATLTATAGSSVKVREVATGLYVLVEHSFAGGEVVVMDFASETVTVDGRDATADVAIESDFFPLSAGIHTLAFEGCSEHTVSWTRRWA